MAEALEASDLLSGRGISLRVVDAYSLKPIDEAAILEAAEETAMIFSAEDHNVVGGLGAAISEVLAGAGAGTVLRRIGLPDEYSLLGPPTHLYRHYGMDAEGDRGHRSRQPGRVLTPSVERIIAGVGAITSGPWVREKGRKPVSLLEGKVAFVTGAASRRGIGRAIALTFARAGASVAVADIDEGGAAETVEELRRASGSEAHAAYVCDVTSREQVEGALAAVADEIGAPTVLVNNSGITQPKRLVEISDADYDAVMDVSLRGSFLASQAVVPYMREAGGGSIVYLSSVSAERGGGVFGGPHYAAAKAGILGLMRADGPRPGSRRYPGQRRRPRLYRHGHHGGQAHAGAAGRDRGFCPPRAGGENRGRGAGVPLPGERHVRLRHGGGSRRERRHAHLLTSRPSA